MNSLRATMRQPPRNLVWSAALVVRGRGSWSHGGGHSGPPSVGLPEVPVVDRVEVGAITAEVREAAAGRRHRVVERDAHVAVGVERSSVPPSGRRA